MTLDVLDVTLPAVRDAATERVVDSNVDTFLRAMMTVQQASRLGTIELMFCEKRVKRGGWFYTGEVSEDCLSHSGFWLRALFYFNFLATFELTAVSVSASASVLACLRLRLAGVCF